MNAFYCEQLQSQHIAFNSFLMLQCVWMGRCHLFYRLNYIFLALSFVAYCGKLFRSHLTLYIFGFIVFCSYLSSLYFFALSVLLLCLHRRKVTSLEKILKENFTTDFLLQWTLFNVLNDHNFPGDYLDMQSELDSRGCHRKILKNLQDFSPIPWRYMRGASALCNSV